MGKNNGCNIKVIVKIVDVLPPLPVPTPTVTPVILSTCGYVKKNKCNKCSGNSGPYYGQTSYNAGYNPLIF